MNQFRLSAAFLILLTGTRAVSFGTALFSSSQQRRSNRLPVAPATVVSVPHPVTFREVYGRGLLVDAWINSVGPFTLAVDTGAGATILSPRVAAEAHVNVQSGRGPSIAGMSGAIVAANHGVIQSLALGDTQNYLPTKPDVIISSGLPQGLDGLLDPNDAFGPLGYVIDISGRELSAFDPHQGGLSGRAQPHAGAIISWLQEGNSHRPFVLLDNGDKALLDTGSSLGLVVRDHNPMANGRRSGAVHDVGGSVSARRGTPQTVAIGSLVLRNVPTDFISGGTADAPTMLGLNALRPFRLTFDPLHRLIEIVEHDRGYGRR